MLIFSLTIMEYGENVSIPVPSEIKSGASWGYLRDGAARSPPPQMALLL